MTDATWRNGMADDGEVDPLAFEGVFGDAASRACLNSRVNMMGSTIDLGKASSMDYREYFMCWQLTRVLALSVAEKVPPALVRRVVVRRHCSEEIPPSPAA